MSQNREFQNYKEYKEEMKKNGYANQRQNKFSLIEDKILKDMFTRYDSEEDFIRANGGTGTRFKMK